MEKVQSREMSLADASRDYAVPKTTAQRKEWDHRKEWEVHILYYF